MKKPNVSKMKFIKKLMMKVKNSFKRCNTKIIYVMFFDLLFFASLLLLPMLWNHMVMGHPMSEQVVKLQNGGAELLDMEVEELAEFKSMMGGFIWFFIISLVVMVILVYLIHSFTRAMIWLVIHKKKPEKNYFKKMLLLNVIWVPLLALIIVVLLIIRFPVNLYSYKMMVLNYIVSLVFMLMVFIPLNLNFMVYHYYTHKGKIFPSLRLAFLVFFKKIRHFIFPILMMFVVFTLISLPFGLIPGLIDKYKMVYALVIIVYIAWLRFYLVEILHNIEHHV